MSKAFKEPCKTVPKASEFSADENPIISLSQIKPKFIRRNISLPFAFSMNFRDIMLNLKGIEQILIPKLRAKRFYIGQLHEHWQLGLSYKTRPSIDELCLKVSKKTLKCLTHISKRKNVSKKLIKMLQGAKCLRNVEFKSMGFPFTDSFFRLLKSARGCMSDVNISQMSNFFLESEDILRLYLALGHCHHLKKLRLNIELGLTRQDGLKDSFCFEKDFMERYLGRLPHLKEFRASHWSDSKTLGNCLREGTSQQYPLVTSLSFHPTTTMLPANLDIAEISKREKREGYNLKTGRYDSNQLIQAISDFLKDDNTICETQEASLKFGVNQALSPDLRRRLVQNFDFSLFPNLRALSLDFTDTVGFEQKITFLGGGFATLKNLQMISLKFGSRPYGTQFIFQELLDLPLLTNFSLRILILEEEEWSHLAKFIQKQYNLTSFSLEITHPDCEESTNHRKQSLGLGNMLQAFEKTPKLEHLDLDFSDYPFTMFAQKCISLGLEHASRHVKSLKSLSFGGILLPIDYGIASWDHLEGFREFIHQQKLTLTSLNITLDFLINADAATYLSAVIPDLQRLKSLNFKANSLGDTPTFKRNWEAFIVGGHYNKDNLQEFLKMQNKTWKSLANHFQAILPKLSALEKLSFGFERSDLTFGKGAASLSYRQESNQKLEQTWNEESYFKLLKTLPRLTSLRSLEIGVSGELLDGALKEQTLDAFIGLKHVNRVKIYYFGEKVYTRVPSGFREMYKAVEQENMRKFVRILPQ